jgi:hypothetical protein
MIVIDPSVIKPGAGREGGEKVEGKRTGTIKSAMNYVSGNVTVCYCLHMVTCVSLRRRPETLDLEGVIAYDNTHDDPL